MARSSLTLVVVLFALVLVVLCCLSSFSEAKSIAAGRFALNGKTTADAGSNQLDWYAPDQSFRLSPGGHVASSRRACRPKYSCDPTNQGRGLLQAGKRDLFVGLREGLLHREVRQRAEGPLLLVPGPLQGLRRHPLLEVDSE